MQQRTDVDRVLHSIGLFGKYQKIQMALIALFSFESSLHIASMVFIGYRPSYKCAEINVTSYLDDHNSYFTNASQLDVNYGKCKIDILVNQSSNTQHFTEDCINGYNYGIPYDRTTVTEWDLVCSGAERSELAKTMLMLGQAVGALIFAPLSDRFGRKTSNVIARILYLLTGLATVFTPSIDVFLLFRFLQGTFQGGIVMTCHVLCAELTPQQMRHQTRAIMALCWSTGLVFVSLVGYIFRNNSWRYMQLFLSVLTVHALFDWLFFDESLRWLLTNGKTERVLKVLKKACKQNSVSFNKVLEENKISSSTITDGKLDTIKNANSNEGEELQSKKVEKYSVLTLFKHKKIFLHSICLWLDWITITLTYYGLMLTTSKLSGDRFLNNVLGSLSEFPATAVQFFFVNRIGRKKMLTVFHAFAALSLILVTVCSTYKDVYSWLSPLANAFTFVGRFGARGAFMTVFLYTPEIYPTNMRNSGLGIASMISRVGSMMSPFAVTLSEYVSWGPTAVFAALNFIVMISLQKLPESTGRQLPTTLEDMKVWHKKANTSTKL